MEGKLPCEESCRLGASSAPLSNPEGNFRASLRQEPRDTSGSNLLRNKHFRHRRHDRSLR